MAHAYRKSGNPASSNSENDHGSVLHFHGTYNMDCKVTVEWALEIPLGEFDRELSKFLTVPRSSSSLKSFISALCRSRLEFLPNGRISSFRAARPTVANCLKSLSDLSIIRIDPNGIVTLVRE